MNLFSICIDILTGKETGYVEPLQKSLEVITASAKKERDYYKALVEPLSFRGFIKDVTLPLRILWNATKVVAYAVLGVALAALSLLASAAMLLLFFPALIITAAFTWIASRFSDAAWDKWVGFIGGWLESGFERLPAVAFVALVGGVYGALQSTFTALQQLVTFPVYLVGKAVYNVLTLFSFVRKTKAMKELGPKVNAEFFENVSLLRQLPEESGLRHISEEALKKYQPNALNPYLLPEGSPKRLEMGLFLQQLVDQYQFLKARGIAQFIDTAACFDLENPRSFIRLSLQHYYEHKPNNEETHSNIALQLLLGVLPSLSDCYLYSVPTFEGLMHLRDNHPHYGDTVNEVLNELRVTMDSISSRQAPFHGSALHRLAVNFLLAKTSGMSSADNFMKKLAILKDPDNLRVLQAIACRLDQPDFVEEAHQETSNEQSIYKVTYWFYIGTLFNNPPEVCLDVLNGYDALKNAGAVQDIDKKFVELCALVAKTAIDNRAEIVDGKRKITYELRAQLCKLIFATAPGEGDIDHEATELIKKVCRSRVLTGLAPSEKNRFERGKLLERFYPTDTEEEIQAVQGTLSNLLSLLVNRVHVPPAHCLRFVNNLLAFYQVYETNILKLNDDGQEKELPEGFLRSFWDSCHQLVVVGEEETKPLDAHTYLSELPAPYQVFFTTEDPKTIYGEVLAAAGRAPKKSAKKVVAWGEKEQQDKPTVSSAQSTGFFKGSPVERRGGVSTAEIPSPDGSSSKDRGEEAQQGRPSVN